MLSRSSRAVGVLFLIAACAPAVKRDLSNMPAGQVGFDDLCGLQTYFDMLALKKGTAPIIVKSSEIEGETSRLGRTRFAFETAFQLQVIRRILNDNWNRLPPGTANAPRVDIEVEWSQRTGLRRLVADEDSVLIVGSDGAQRFGLPYHVCLSELLFGEPLYRQRRDLLGLAPLPLSRSMVLESDRDAGTGDSHPKNAGPREAGTPNSG